MNSGIIFVYLVKWMINIHNPYRGIKLPQYFHKVFYDRKIDDIVNIN